MSEVFYCGVCAAEHRTQKEVEWCCTLGYGPCEYDPLESDGVAKADVPQPKAAELLGRAAKLMHERGQTYDKPEGERSMERVVSAFNTVTGHALKESEGWLFMTLLKAVRSETRSEPHQDSLEDLIAYAALYAEARGEGR